MRGCPPCVLDDEMLTMQPEPAAIRSESAGVDPVSGHTYKYTPTYISVKPSHQIYSVV